jgi:4-oxalocrotonate tautomerase
MTILPIVSVQTYSGESQREKDRLAEAVTEDIVKILKVSKEEVIVLFYRSNSWKLVCCWCSSIRNNHVPVLTNTNDHIITTNTDYSSVLYFAYF